MKRYIAQLLPVFTFVVLPFWSQGFGSTCLPVSAANDTTYQYLYVCPGSTTVEYSGNHLSAGDILVFQAPGYVNSDSLVKVVVLQAPVIDFWATAEPACTGSSNGEINFWDRVGPTAPYEFSIDGGQTFYDEYTYTDLPGGQYELRARDASGCVYEYEVEIPEIPSLAVATPAAVTSCADSVKLTFSVGTNPLPYQWQWRLPSAASPAFDTVLWVKVPGEYFLQVSNECETVKRTIQVDLEKKRVLRQIYFPNSFSPNGDSINDCFRGYTSPDLQLLDYQFFVFDRWGEQVFETHNIEGCWDGTFQGEALDSGIFVWWAMATIVDCEGEGAELIRQGDVWVSR